jgi:TrmH family RNA methyltransferase
LNIGSAARAMSNFGFTHLRVVNPYEVAFHEARSAVGAAEILASAETHASVAEAVADCGLVMGTTAVGRREVQHPLLRLEEAAEAISRATCKVALLFGSEKRGLSNDDLSYCHSLVHIPTHAEHLSMNLGQAVAVCLYEFSRKRGPIPSPESEPARSGDLARITSVLTEALHHSGYMKSEALPSTEEKVRRLTRRLNLSASDAELLLGMLRRIHHRLRLIIH